MTQFCALFLGIYALLALQRGAMHNFFRAKVGMDHY